MSFPLTFEKGRRKSYRSKCAICSIGAIVNAGSMSRDCWFTARMSSHYDCRC